MSKKYHQPTHKQQGFTVVELMISTAVFSVVLLLCSTAIIHVGRMYYKGVITNRTQDGSRAVLEDITQAVQFGNSGTPAEFKHTNSGNFTNPSGQSVNVQSMCLGQTRYSYVTNRAMGSAADQAPRILWRDTVTPQVAVTCPPVNIVTAAAPVGTGAVGFLGNFMRLPIFEAIESGGAWNIRIRVSYGDAVDLFVNNGNQIVAGEGTFAYCKSVLAGGEFCAVSNLNTSVAKRL